MSGENDKPKGKKRGGRVRDALDAAAPVPPPEDAAQAGDSHGDDGQGDAGGEDMRDEAEGVNAFRRPRYYRYGDAYGDDDADWRDWHTFLPPDSPVLPLGESRDFVYVLDHRRYLQELEPAKLKDMLLVKIFGGVRFLVKHWTKFVRGKPEPTWDHTPVREAVMQACSRAGTFNPANKVRGRGCWRGDDGELIVHLGNAVIRNGEHLKPGIHGEHIYPFVEPALPAPIALDGDGENVGELILERLETWNWVRGSLDARLMLGWTCAAPLGGALRWRPAAVVVGDQGTGKSTLQEFVRDLLAPGIVSTANTTAAGIYQHLGLDSLPVAVDEFEANPKSERGQALLELMRQASSGNVMLRGGATHSGVQFEARSAFLFSGILPPPLPPQDMSRIALLELNELKAVKFDVDASAARRHRKWGAALVWRLIQQWPRFEATLDVFKTALADVGHSPRGQDQFGTLLALADLALNDVVPSLEQIADDGFVAQLNAATLNETKLNTRDYQRCADHLTSRLLDVFKDSSKRTLAWWLRKGVTEAEGMLPEATTQELLRTFGMKLLKNPLVDKTAVPRTYLQGWHLAIASSHAQMSALFAGSKWEAPPGLTGGWIGTLKRTPGAALAKKQIDGMSRNCVLVPIEALITLDKEEDVRRDETVDDTKVNA